MPHFFIIEVPSMTCLQHVYLQSPWSTQRTHHPAGKGEHVNPKKKGDLWSDPSFVCTSLHHWAAKLLVSLRDTNISVDVYFKVSLFHQILKVLNVALHALQSEGIMGTPRWERFYIKLT